MINRAMRIGDLVSIREIECAHMELEDSVITPAGYYPICYVYEDNDGSMTIGIRVEEELLYIPDCEDDIILDHIAKY